MKFEIVAITDETGSIIRPDLLAAAEKVHCQLRPHLAGAYGAVMLRVIGGGAEMCVAMEGGSIRGLAVFRVYENTS
jgi:hypothetical protein